MTRPSPSPADFAAGRDRLVQIPTDAGRTGTVHRLKTLPGYFQQVWVGRKTFEVRYDDRGFQRGDRVQLREWDRDWTCGCEDRDHDTYCERYTGREITAEIGYVLAFTPSRGSQRGFNGNGYVVFSLLHRENTSIDRRTNATGAGTDTTITTSTGQPS